MKTVKELCLEGPSRSELQLGKVISKKVDVVKKSSSVIKSDYKVFVFDLDNTLYLHGADEMYKQIYHEQVKVFLQNLKNVGKILCIATHNKNPTIYLDRLKITSLFHYIISEQKKVRPSLNRIDEYTGKDEMINELISKIGCTNKEIIFFDDANYNIKKVESIGVKSILVSDQTGIDFTKLNISGSLKRKLTIVKNKMDSTTEVTYLRA